MKIAVIFGGKSCEHDISIITGVMTINAAVKHHVIPVYVNGKGQWITGKDFNKTSTFLTHPKGKKVHLRPGSNRLYCESGKVIADLDAVIICCHGYGGEDGTLSGLLELTGIPYVGSGVLASAVGMDKIIQKRVFRDAGLPVVPFIGIKREEANPEIFPLVDKINQELTFPLIVKPNNLGSSIGITRAKDFAELFSAIESAFMWDNSVIIENALTGFTEVNCAVFGYGSSLTVSEIEQPLSGDFLSYKDKYENRGKGSTGRYLPAHISTEMAQRVRELAKSAFSILGASGVARVDFLIDGDNLYVNEINTVPGSMANYLYTPFGIDFPALIEKLLIGALAAKKAKESLKYTFNSDVLRNIFKISK